MGGRAIGRALVAGLGAGLILTATMLALRLWLAAPTFPERVADPILLAIPQALFGATLDRLGFAAKPLLFVGIVAAQVAILALLGFVYAALAVLLAGRLDLTNPALGGAIGLFGGLVADFLLLPFLGIPAPLGARRAVGPALVQAALPALAYGVALAGLIRLGAPARPIRDPQTNTFGPPRQRLARRDALTLLLTALGVLVTAGALRRLIGAMLPPGAANVAPPPQIAPIETPAGIAQVAPTSTPPPPTTTPVPPTVAPTGTAATAPATPAPPTMVPTAAAPTPPTSPTPLPATPSVVASPIPPGVAAQITPTEQFYLISKNLIDPDLRANDWQLTINGLVGRQQTLRHADLLLLPPVTVAATLECISNEPGGALIGTARWTGVPLRAILAGAGVRPEATHVVFTCADDYVERLPLAQALDSATILVHTMNGTPLTAKHGFPARLLAAGRYGMKNPKWVVGIELVARAVPSYWSQRGWDPDAPVQVFTRVDAPRDATPPGPVRVGGVAYAGDRGISRVEISGDEGATWQPTELEAPLSALTWVRWAATWTPPGPGTYTLAARAWDGDGTPQVAAVRTIDARGATGYGRRVLTIAAR